jgi:phosphate-selective porin OprO/OprP
MPTYCKQLAFLALALVVAVPVWAQEPPADAMAPRPVTGSKNRYRPGEGMELRTDDEAFSVRIRGRAQFRYEALHDADAARLADGESGDWKHTAMIRRARLSFVGHVFDPHVRYQVQLNFAPQDVAWGDNGPQNGAIRDWFVTLDHKPNAVLRFGQMKVPYNRERVNSSGDLQFADRALSNGEFNLDRDIGIQLRSDDFLATGKLKYAIGAFKGDGRDGYKVQDAGGLLVARAEVLPMGKFADYEQADFARESSPKLAVGASYAQQWQAKRDQGQLGNKPLDGGTTDLQHVQGDFIFKFRGLSWSSEVFWRKGERNAGSAKDKAGDPIAAVRPRNGWGWMSQAGWLLPGTDFEVAGRFSAVNPLGGATSMSERREAGPGVSWYFHEHAWKLQADLNQLWDKDGFADGSQRIRIQAQLVF